MTEIIGFCNQKGGVGKTTSAINMAASLAVAEKKTLLIDLDPQANATTGLGIDKKSISSNSYSLVIDLETVDPQKTALPYLSLVPSTSDLVGAEVELVKEDGRERRLQRALQGYEGRYDYILIDGPPALGILTLNILTAARGVVIPVQCEYYALEGLSDLLQTIELVKRSLNPQLEIVGILLTMFDSRNNLAHDVEEEIRRHFREKVFRTVIPRSVRLSEAPSHGKPVIQYDARSRGAQCYLEAAQELLSRVVREGGEVWNERRSVGGSPR